jgi:hypothetical protein
VAARGTAVEREGAGVGRGRFRDLSGAEQDIAGESLDLGGGGCCCESAFGCGERLREFVGCDLGTGKTRVDGGRRRGCDLCGVEGFGALNVAGDEGGKGLSASGRRLNGAVDFAVCGGLGWGLGEGDERQEKSCKDNKKAHEWVPNEE